ncbi:MAG: YbaN family protein [Pseudomonadota bacterium]
MPPERPTPQNANRQRGRLEVTFFRLLGGLLLAVGLVGIWVPVMPTTIFLIGAAACFARSTPALNRYLLQHKRFGPPLRDWFNEGAIGLRAKIAAVIGMAFGMVITIIATGEPLWIALAGVVLGWSAWYVLSRPRPSRERATPP